MNSSLAVAAFLYFLGMVKYLLYLGMRRQALFWLATAAIALGFVAETVGLGERSMVTGHGPYTSGFEYALFAAWTVFAIFLLAEGMLRIKALGAFMVPVGFGCMMIAVAIADPGTAGEEATHAYWLTLHRTLSFVSFGAFTLIFAAGAMYLIQERQLKAKRFGGWYQRLPALDVLDHANRLGLSVGLPVVTIGVVAAMFWSHQHYGETLRLTPSAVGLLAAWGIYCALGIGRVLLGWRGRRAAVMGMIGFAVVVGGLALHIGG